MSRLLTLARASRCVARPSLAPVVSRRAFSSVAAGTPLDFGNQVIPQRQHPEQEVTSTHGEIHVHPPPDSTPVGLTGGAPEEFVRRSCRIYKPSRSATQQGPEYRWKIEFDTPNKWVNPLMGWTSARDTAQQLREMLYFKSEEDAIAFAQREGFEYTILPYHAKILKAKSFADNFKWRGQPKVVQQK